MLNLHPASTAAALPSENILANLTSLLKQGDVGGALSLLDTQSRSPSSTPSVCDLYAQWQRQRGLSYSGVTEAEADARYRIYADLQSQIIAADPQTPQDVAIQLIVHTDDGDSDFSDAFLERLRQISQSKTAPMDENPEAACSSSSLQVLCKLLDHHAHQWEIDQALWQIYSDIEDGDAMEACPPLRVQISTLRHGCDENGQYIRSPIYAFSLEEIAAAAQENMDFQIGLFVSRDNAAGIARLEAKRAEWVADKTAQFNAISAERERIQDECGYTAAEEAAFVSSDVVKGIERQIIELVPGDIKTARLKAAWTIKAYENDVGYIGTAEVFETLKSIGTATA